MKDYKIVIIETFINQGESTNAKIRARPLSGQNLDTNMRVECSRSMREKIPIGSKIKILAKVTNRQGGKDFLYCPVNADYEILSEEEAKKYITQMYSGT